MSPTPPAEFVAKLERFDSSLRLRWGVRTELWIIERKMDPRHKQLLSERPNPWRSARGWDLYDGWAAGYVHILNVSHELLDDRVFDVLADADAYRQGGMDAIGRKLDELDAQAEAEVDRKVKNFQEAAASEAYDRLTWLQGNRVAVSTPEPPLIDADGYKIRDRRRLTQ